MGLIKARENFTRGECFACEALPSNVLLRKGAKALRDGSHIYIADSQAALIVEDGRVIDFSAETGGFIWEEATEPSCFTGGAYKGMLESFKRTGGSFTYSGSHEKTKNVYYFNLDEITDNKFGTASPVKYYDLNYKTALYIRYYGTLSLRIADPIMFFASLAENIGDEYTKDMLWPQISDEFTFALDAAVAKCAETGIKFSSLPSKQAELTRLTGEALTERGLELVSVGIAKVTPDERSRGHIAEYEAKATPADKNAIEHTRMEALKKANYKGRGSISAMMARDFGKNAQRATAKAGGFDSAPMKALKTAAPHESGSLSALMARGYGENAEVKGDKAIPESAVLSAEWICSDCGRKNDGKFCSECGRKR